jgi:four helix bundle suffix protein
MENKIVLQTGNYKKLISYQKANAIYCMTFYFINHYLVKGDRTRDQMLQAARSGKQNIVEGCAASSTSAKTEIKLVSVAKASLKELLEDYEDYLRTRGFRQWEKNSIEYICMRNLGKMYNNAAFYMRLIKTRPPQTIANMCIILLHQTDYLLFRQLARLEQDFKEHGGFSERMYQARKVVKGKSNVK